MNNRHICAKTAIGLSNTFWENLNMYRRVSYNEMTLEEVLLLNVFRIYKYELAEDKGVNYYTRSTLKDFEVVGRQINCKCYKVSVTEDGIKRECCPEEISDILDISDLDLLFKGYKVQSPTLEELYVYAEEVLGYIK